jgi:hypothetical protein
MEKVPPDWVVLRVTGLGPFQAAVPVPRMTCSWVPSTVPVSASTSTVSRLAPSAPLPSTVDSQARRAVAPRAYTTSRVDSTPVKVRSWPIATFAAAAPVSFGVVGRLPIGWLSATEWVRTLPALLVAITKSPPITGRPA